MNAMRRGGLAAPALAKPVGNIASSNGRATAVPMPRNTVRREISLDISLLRCGPLLERVTLDDFDDQGGEPVVPPARGVHERAHRPPVVPLQAAAEGVGEHLLGGAAHERVPVRTQDFPEPGGTLERPAVGEDAGGVDLNR